jgi:hypothetical protein
MSKGIAIMYSGVIVLNLGLTAYHSYNYFSKTQLENIAIITPQAEAVDKYSGSAPKKELDNLLDRIDIVKADNPSYAQDIIKLEDTVYKTKAAIGDTTDPAVYSPLMDEMAKNTTDFVNNHNRSGSSLAGASIWLLNAGINSYFLAKTIQKDRERAAREARRAGRAAGDGIGRTFDDLLADVEAGRYIDPAELDEIIEREIRANLDIPNNLGDPEAGQPEGPARNTDARDDDNDIWTNRDNDVDENQQPRNTRRIR